MKYDEFFEYATTNSGNYLIPDESLELDRSKFLSVIKICLGIYNRYTPLHYTFRINQYTGGYNYTFTGREYPQFKEFGEYEMTPKKISDALPVWSSYINPFSSWVQAQSGTSIADQAKQMVVWRYDRPVLRLDRVGEVEVTAIYDHPILEFTLENGDKSIELPSISESDVAFLDLMTAKFMQIIGRARRLFGQSENTLIIDYDGMLSDGRQKEESAMADIIANAKFYLSY